MDITDTLKPADRLLPFAQALDLVGISRSHIYLLLEQGSFPAPTKIGRCNYFSEQELQEWIQAELSKRAGDVTYAK